MLASAARQIFEKTLLRIDAGSAVRDALHVDGTKLVISETSIDLSSTKIYVIAIGKAAYKMADALNRAVGGRIEGGVVSGVRGESEYDFTNAWQLFEGGHPLPTEESLAAGRACFNLLERANYESAVVVFLISGGGSAMAEMPRDERVTLDDLRQLNSVLITSGAPIAEINAVRRAVSAVKGGGLAKCARHARQISLIISDTAPGDIASVASGPSLYPSVRAPDAAAIIDKYDLISRLPASIVGALQEQTAVGFPTLNALNSSYTLLDNVAMLAEAARLAAGMGFAVKVDEPQDDEMIVPGCEALFARFLKFRRSVAGGPVCFISGGEFGCTVNGTGRGGRNLETVLRLAMLAREEKASTNFAILSAGTDGIDGNSPAAGAVTDNTLFTRAFAQKMVLQEYLENSDSFTFFDALGDTIITGPTGTNVRDLRIIIG